jgi:hypothetical protein
MKTAATLIAASLAAAFTTSASACGGYGQPPCMQNFGPIQAAPPPVSAFQPSFQPAPMMTMQTYGHTTTITTPGAPMVTCTRFGTTTTCR